MRFLDVLRGESRHSVTTVDDWIAYNGHRYPVGVPGFQLLVDRGVQPAVDPTFAGFAEVMRSNGVVWALEQIRSQTFSSVRFQWQELRSGRPGRMFSSAALDPLNEPPDAESLRGLLATMLLVADVAGAWYGVRRDDRVVSLRPDWMDVVFAKRPDGLGVDVIGYRYHDGGRHQGNEPVPLEAAEVAAFRPMPDPAAPWRGVSWLSPVIREVMADNAARDHKLRFFENGAVPGLAVSLKESVGPDEFQDFMDMMDHTHKGVDNAYKTMYLGGGADVTVIGANLGQLDFKSTQGAGETRLAMAAGVPAVVLGSSEGMQGSSLNAGNYAQARRRFADGTLHPLWMEAAGALQNVFPPPRGARLWYDARDVPFLRDDTKDQAEIFHLQAQAARTLVDGGFEADSVVDAIDAMDLRRLSHSGKLSVQLQEPGTKPERQVRVFRDANGAISAAEG